MGFDSIWHWGLLLLIVILVFGTRKIGNIGTDLGQAVRGFKQAVRSNENLPAEPRKPHADPAGTAVTSPPEQTAHAAE